MKNVTKYHIKEVFSTTLFFYTCFLIIILLSNVDDFPLQRMIIGVVVFSLFVSFYEIYLAKRLEKVLRAPLFILTGIVYYFAIFLIMLVIYSYVFMIFKEGYSVNEVLRINIFERLPENLHWTFFFLLVFLTIRSLSQNLKIRTIQGLAANYFMNKKNEPMKVSRIFMFMDLVSSTSYAERLGHVKYSEFISRLFRELDEYVLATKGKIYQYVGDEVVVVWSLKDGLQNANCIRFYYLFEQRLEEMKEFFHEEYGIFPSFKAGYHLGEVVIAEVGGILKKDIAFHGDPVNTTARICSKCRELDENLLVSRDLMNKLIEEKW